MDEDLITAQENARTLEAAVRLFNTRRPFEVEVAVREAAVLAREQADSLAYELEGD